MSSCRSSNGSQSSWNFSHALRLEARSQPLVRRTPPTSQKSAVISPTHRLLQHLKTPGKIFAQMDAQRAPVPLRQNFEVTTRLSGLDDSKREFLSGYREVCCLVTGDLQKDAGVRPALVGLTGGVEEARAEAETRRHAPGIADGVADGLEQFAIRLVHGDVGEHGEVVARAEPVEVGAKEPFEGPSFACGPGQGRRIPLVGEKFDPAP